jgi:hypothetical protein
MFNIFKPKTDIEKLRAEKKILLTKSYIASKNSRRLSDKLLAEAMEIDQKIEKIRASKNPSNMKQV